MCSVWHLPNRHLTARCELITTVLCRCPNSQQAWNSLEDGATSLGDMLAANMGLKHLDLSHCRIGSEACMMLGEGLKSNMVLEVLLLSGNDRIGEDGARHLMMALAANRSLQFLGLNGSNMTCT